MGSAPKTFGFLLMNCYPIASLADPILSLKSVDLILFHVLTSRFECVLTPAFLNKDNDVGVPFLDDQGSKKNVFLISDFPDDLRPELNNNNNDDVMSRHAPLISPVAWIEIGFGQKFAQSGCLGNADCGARFAYRETALVVLFDKPSKWARRRIAFWIQEKGEEGNMFQRIGKYYPIFRNVVHFM